MMGQPKYAHYMLIVAAVVAGFFVLERLPLGQQISLSLGQVLVWVQAPVRWVDDVSLWFRRTSEVQAELVQARQGLVESSSLTQQNQSLREENRALRALLHITDIQGYQWRAVQVLGRSPEKKSRHLIVHTQAHEDDVVVASTGLVGLVNQSRNGIAVVRTILDGSQAVPVTLHNTQLAALVRGQGSELSVDFIPLNQAPNIGDVLQTSGAGGVFPPGISVAKVTRVDEVPGRIFAHVEAVPTAHWQRESWLAIATHAAASVSSIPQTMP